jgi:hypothetical protein
MMFTGIVKARTEIIPKMCSYDRKHAIMALGEVMGFDDGINREQRQYINLNNAAWDVIESDMLNFGGMEKDRNLSGFLNIIFSNFYRQAAASVSIEAQSALEKFTAAIQDIELGSVRHKTLDAIKAAYVEHICKPSQERKGKGDNFRVNDKNIDYLTGASCRENQYYDRIGDYLKALYEEYASLPYIKREQIYYGDFLKEITEAIKEGCRLDLTLQSGRSMQIRPYKVLSNSLSTYNYLVGYTVPPFDSGEEAKIASFRISRLKAVAAQAQRAGRDKLTKDERAEINRQISQKEAPYLVGKMNEIHIRLTPAGVKEYNSRIHQRPQYKEIRDGNVYIFECTQSQIEHFFLSFGKDAEVLLPAPLRHSFADKYRQALLNYRETE